MKVSEILKDADGTRFSIEVYPPKAVESIDAPPFRQHLSDIFETVEHLKRFDPAFVSVTYNATGETRATSIPVAAIIKQRYRIESVAHLTCIATSREELGKTLDVLDYFRIDNILALRGDVPENYTPMEDEMIHADELVSEIRKHRHDFDIGVAGYPEGHQECLLPNGERDLEKDMSYFVNKVDKGASFAISQVFYTNEQFFEFVNKTKRSGMDIPILPGIMPITDTITLRIIRDLCGASIPSSLEQKLKENREDADEIRAIGVDHAIRQCKGLMDRVPCIHFYTMDKWEATDHIIDSLM